MFSDESLLEVNWPGRGPRCYFVPKANVRFGNGQHGAVRVKVVTHAGGPWAVLPTGRVQSAGDQPSFHRHQPSGRGRRTASQGYRQGYRI